MMEQTTAGWQCSNCGVTVPLDKSHWCTWVPSRTSELEAELTRLREELGRTIERSNVNLSQGVTYMKQRDILLAALRKIAGGTAWLEATRVARTAISEVEEER